MAEANVLELPSLVYRLCSKLSPIDSDRVSTLYSTTMTLLSNDNRPLNLDDPDEFYVIEKIKKLLSKNMREGDGLRFEELYYKLKRIGNCRNPIGMAFFLYEMSCLDKTKDSRLNLLGQDIPIVGSNNTNNNHLYEPFMLSGLKSHMNGASSKPPSPCAPLPPDFLSEFDDYPHSKTGQKNLRSNPRIKGTKTPRPCSLQIDNAETKKKFAEIELLREILFAFQGLDGRILVKDPSNDGRYKISPDYNIGVCERQIVIRLTHIGWLFNKVRMFCDLTLRNETLGYVCQSFASALQEEVQRYYRLVTVIEQELHSYATDFNSKAGLTLLRLQVYIYDSFHLLKVLVILIENCKNKRGGALIKEVHKYNQHGDPSVRQCMTRLLRQVVLPIRQMLSQWIFHGEIDDPYKEFFITSSRSCMETHHTLWHEKYQLNKAMFPGFIDVEQGKKILATGKAVNLLKHVFEDKSCGGGYDVLRKTFESTEVELLFNDESQNGQDGEFQKLLQKAYRETSEKVLTLLFKNFHFMDHLMGLRKFMLLGQGDFIRHLMDLLVHELEKPAQSLKLLNLKSLLNSAIRATNAQFLDEDVIERVDVRFADTLEDTGWDIFLLDYQTNGPIKTILNPQIMDHYSKLFKYLWRSKRMEYVLVSLWKQQITRIRDAKLIPKLYPVFHNLHILQSEMMHFIQQMQYYIEFEVMECSWDELIRKMEKASDIDQLIEAQESFLTTVISRSMLDSESQSLAEQLRAIYDRIIEFQTLQDAIFKAIDVEVEQRNLFDAERRLTKENIELVVQKETERRKNFEQQSIPDYKIKIHLLGRTYESMVQKFLMLLAVHQDADLRFLSFRLDFNEHYARRNRDLETSFTFSKRSSLDFAIMPTRV
ncbi:gamma-tubulin complex component 3 homolog [Brevipalpus obovatus]|uniref:gamma-tubulin complex component 3 homolog n=1 Tax=Brevipalpus obovatus TaxID=246614 RepID=UPI003D9DE62F